MSPDHYKARFGDGRASAQARLLAGGGSRAYDAARYDTREMSGWNPPVTSGTDENLDSREAVVKRARDLERNHPIISGATDRRAESVVGPNIRLELMPAFELLGITADEADEWSSMVEQHFELFSRDPRKLCDSQMHLQFGGMVEMAYRHWWNDGEACARVRMLKPTGPRVGARFETCLEVIDPDRISNPRGLPDHHKLPNGRELIGGIEYDRNGAPIAAHVRKSHPATSGAGAMDTFTWARIPYYNRFGRPNFIHAMKRKRADQRRGISRAVAALKRIKMLDRYDDAEIEAALLNAVMAVSVESPYPTADVAAAMAPAASDNDELPGWSVEGQMSYRMDNPVRVAGARVIHTLPGEELKFNRAEHPSANYPEFQGAGLRAVASSLGLSYAQLSQNWSDINYSSARTMLNEIWRGLLHDRWLFTQAFCTPFFLAWLEEAIARGVVPMPRVKGKDPRKIDFYLYRNELSLCEWMGPGRGTVDPLKEATAREFELNQGTTDEATIASEQGRDINKSLFRQQRVDKMREKYGRPAYQPLKRGSGPVASDDQSQDSPSAPENEADRRESEDV